MSISSVANAPNPILASLLSQLNGAASDDFSPDDAGDAQGASPASNALTGSTKPALGGQILQTLISLQQDGGATASGTNPVQNLFSAMDTNGDGEVSQSEMENAIEQDGGTQTQADALYQALGGANSASGGLSESQFASAVQQSGSSASAAHPHHHHGHGHGGGAGDALANILDAAQSDTSIANTGTTATNTTATGTGTLASAETDFVDAANSVISGVTSPFQSLMNEVAQVGSLTNIAA